MRARPVYTFYTVNYDVFYAPEIYGRVIPIVCVKRDKIVFGIPRKIFDNAVSDAAVYVQTVGKTILEDDIFY